jgi:DNA-binding NtrC family response regulator
MVAPLRVLAVDDESDTSEWLKRLLEKQGYSVKVATTGRESERILDNWTPDLVLLDMVLPDVDGLDLLSRFRSASPETQVVMITGHGSVAKAVEAMRAGAFSFIEKPVNRDHLLAVLERASERAHLLNENRQVREELAQRRPFPEIVARSEAMQQLFKLMSVVAPTDASVLITGENGTGKELVAAAIHAHSRRSKGPFIRLNCAAIPSELLESELFGHRRGAFTGAVADKVGLVQVADGGTLLLDEIGEMAAPLQAKLLRVLQEREFRPVGSTQVSKLNFRLICATNIDLDMALVGGKLRQDLYFRINTITLNVPPLRERAEDVILLAEHFRAKLAERHQREVTGFDPEVKRLLVRYTWPGNVRELENVVERAVIVSRGPTITVEDLPKLNNEPPAVDDAAFLIPPHHTLADLEKLAILQALERNRGNKRAAAKALGVYRPTLYNKLKKYGIGEVHRKTDRNGDDRRG